MTTKTTKATVKGFATVEALDKAIDAVISKSQSLQSDIQKVAIGIVAHAYKHGDYTRANTLVNGLGEGVRRTALVEWFHRCGMDISEADQCFVGFNKKVCEKRFEEMKGTSWWALKPERPFDGFDLQAELARLLKRAERVLAEEGKRSKEENELVKISPEMLVQLRTLSNATAH